MEQASFHPVDLLTSDCWTYVLAYLECPRDIWNVSHVHPHFRFLLESEPSLKERWMLAKQFACFPQVYKYLPLSNVFDMRRINKLTKSTADIHLKQRLANSGPKFVWPDRHLHPESLPIVPFVKLSVKCERFSENRIQYRAFFQKFGCQVVSLRLEYPQIAPQALRPLEASQLLKFILECTPKIKSLELDLAAAKNNVDLSSTGENWDGGITNLEYFWRANPLPRLSLLDSLTLTLPEGEMESAVYSKPTTLAFAQAYGPQLEHLQLFWHCVPFLRPAGTPFLTKLAIGLRTPEELVSLQNYHAPLLQTVELVVGGDPCTIHPSQLFAALEPFKITLASISIKSESSEFGWIQQFATEVEFPNVQHLRLGDLHGATGPWFFLLDSFPSLKNLDIRLEPRPQNEQADNWNLTNGRSLFSDSELPDTNHFYMSAIWCQLPLLENVRIVIGSMEERSFTRHRFMQLQSIEIQRFPISPVTDF